MARNLTYVKKTVAQAYLQIEQGDYPLTRQVLTTCKLRPRLKPGMTASAAASAIDTAIRQYLACLGNRRPRRTDS
jgi:hypothetical protein